MLAWLAIWGTISAQYLSSQPIQGTISTMSNSKHKPQGKSITSSSLPFTTDTENSILPRSRSRVRGRHPKSEGIISKEESLPDDTVEDIILNDLSNGKDLEAEESISDPVTVFAKI
jgi:hypothetical protein